MTTSPELFPERPDCVSVHNITKRFIGITAVNDVSLAIQSNELTLITGPSGSGKTTLLNIMSGIDRPDTGVVKLGTHNLTNMSHKEQTNIRAMTGQAFQRSGLMAGFTARENIVNPHTLAGNTIDPVWTVRLCDQLDIMDVLDKPASRLSGGQALRVSLVRALAARPRIIFADEPTASLDTASKTEVHEILSDLTDTNELTVVMVSHDPVSKSYADRIIYMRDGGIESDTVQ